MRFSAVPKDEISGLFSNLTGGRPDFFTCYWRRRPLLTRGALSHYDFSYTKDEFLADAKHAGSYAIGSIQGMEMSRDVAAADAHLARQSVVMVNVATVDGSRRPPRFAEFMHLYLGLAKHLNVSFVQPSEYVCSLFLSETQSCIGGHYDNGDAFCLNLFGGKRWRVERRANPERGMKMQLTGYGKAGDIPFEEEPEEYLLEPGDCLYLPAWCLHRVEGLGPSLGLTLGYRAISEVDIALEILRSQLEKVRPDYPPLMTYPPFEAELFAESQAIIKEKVAELLRQIVPR